MCRLKNNCILRREYMKCIKERDLQAFSIWNSILHTPYFARGAYTKDDMHYYSSKQKGYK